MLREGPGRSPAGYVALVEDPEDREDPESRESALRPSRSDLHPADPTDALTDPPSGSPEPDSGALGADPPVDDGLAEPGDGTVEPGDRSPGASALAPPPEAGDADRLQTAEWGREAEAARANTSDSMPVPTETPAP